MKTLGRLWPYCRKGLSLMVLSLLQIVLGVVLGLASPQIIRWVVDRVLTDGHWEWLGPAAAALMLVAILKGALRFGQRYTMEGVSQQVLYDLRSHLYRHLQSLSFGFYDRAQTGELMSRVTADVDSLRMALGVGVVNGLMNVGIVAGTVGAMLAMNWRLALVSLLFLPFLFHAIWQFTGRSGSAWDQVQAETARLSARTQENINGVRVVRAFAQEPAEIDRFERENRAFRERNLAAIRLSAFWSNYMKFLTALGGVAVLWYGGRLAALGEITVGTLIAFNTYVANLLHPVRMLGWNVSMLARAGAGLRRIFGLLDTPSEVQEKPDARELGRVTGRVTFENVSFRYEDREDWVLQDVSLDVRPGQRVAILGMTGSGKSSLVNLIPRFYDADRGRVLIDGMDVRDVTLKSLRKNVAVVQQETFLFSTTLRENIAYGRPEATMAEIMAAAQGAQIHDFIDSLPAKYETEVGERGVGLSGGQKQRIALARALLADSPILILDESTSSVDVSTERQIQAALDRVMQERTSFIIASRLSTVMQADLVVVLDQGRIAQMGTHEELIRQEGLYRQIYELQLSPRDEEVAG